MVREGVREKNELEVKLRQMKVEETERLEEEWWVTKTVGMQEVRSELQKWVGPAKKEYVAMTEELKAVRPVQRKMRAWWSSCLQRRRVRERRRMGGGRFAAWSVVTMRAAPPITYTSGADATQIRSLAKILA